MAAFEQTVIVGADQSYRDATEFASVFVQTGNKWTYKVKLLAPNGTVGDDFGNSVVIDHDTVVVVWVFVDQCIYLFEPKTNGIAMPS